MRVVVDGNPVELLPSTFVAEGGEARIHAVADLAYKVFKDPARVPEAGRLVALARLGVEGPILPCADVFDLQGQRIGFTLPFLDGWSPIVRLFSPAYQRREGVSGQQIAALLARLREQVENVHQRGVVIADLSELNVLVRPDHGAVALIDTDSWGIERFAPRALSESIRDRHASAPSQQTDWLAYAILAFQVMVGIHPFRGRHPTLRSLDARMSAEVSVLHPSVVVPPMVDTSALPDAWRTWFERVFHHRHRGPPPVSGIHRRPAPRVRGLRSSILFEVDSPLHRAHSAGGCLMAWSSAGVFVDGRRVGAGPSPDALPIATRPPAFVRLAEGHVLLEENGTVTDTTLEAHALFAGPDGVFGRLGQTIVRYTLQGSWLAQTVVGHLPSRGVALHRGCVIVRHPTGDRVLVLGRTGAHWRDLPDAVGTVLDAVAQDGFVVLLVDGPQGRVLLLLHPSGQRSFPTDGTSAELLVLNERVVLVLAGSTTWLVDRQAPATGARSVQANFPSPPSVHRGRPVAVEGRTVLAFALEG